MKVTFEEAMELLEVPIPELLKRKGIGHKFVAALAEEYRKILLCRIAAYNELYSETYGGEEDYEEDG